MHSASSARRRKWNGLACVREDKLVEVAQPTGTTAKFHTEKTRVRDRRVTSYCAFQAGLGRAATRAEVRHHVPALSERVHGNRCNVSPAAGSQPFMLAAPALMLLAAVKAQLSA
uniref:Secreted protein n=1 Tax=Macrostomum lignano TaxID=282301 RepID=A0A1I8FLV4_9PLAT